jgi:hypothetical protein
MKYAPAFSVLITLASLIGIAQPATAAATYTNFSIAGATVIYATGVNATGQCTGWYRDASGVDHSFLFQPDGTVITFDVPGSNGTAAMSINGPGKIVGVYFDSGNVQHGFLRNLAGEYTTLNAPGAGALGTTPTSIDDSGEIAGGYFDTSDAAYGFTRDSLGNYTEYSISGNTQVNNALLYGDGEIAGTYTALDTGTNCYCGNGFTRDALGNITTFDGPGAVDTWVIGVNASGETTGIYELSLSGPYQPYLRDAAGTMTTFSVAGWYYTAGIEDNGNIIGVYRSSNSTYFGWQYSAGGILTSFKDPDAGHMFERGTLPTSVSGNGNIAGFYLDSKGVVHGFVMH